MELVLEAVGANPRTLAMVMKADAMITIYEDIDRQWKILQETSIIAKSLRGYRTRNFKMTANKFKLVLLPIPPKIGFRIYIPSIIYAISPARPPFTCTSSKPRTS